MAIRQSKIMTGKLPKRLQFKTAPRQIAQVGRNEPCPCGSGKKFKDCHISEGDAFLKRLAAEREKAELKALRARLREEGVPWYRRLFLRG
ncbi:MAG: SEC-C metal-binding domain-containing protein [Thermoanaerobaculia bacterium]